MFSYQAMFKSNRGTVSGYFLAGRFMTWLPVSQSTPISSHILVVFPTKATIKTRTLAIYLEWNVEVLCDSMKEIPREFHPNPASKKTIYLFIYLFIHLFIYII